MKENLTIENARAIFKMNEEIEFLQAKRDKLVKAEQKRLAINFREYETMYGSLLAKPRE